MGGGRGRACIEAAVRAATCGTLDKGVEAREAGGALLTALVQVWSLLHALLGKGLMCSPGKDTSRSGVHQHGSSLALLCARREAAGG